jgi:hypothetical protein
MEEAIAIEGVENNADDDVVVWLEISVPEVVVLVTTMEKKFVDKPLGEREEAKCNA